MYPEESIYIKVKDSLISHFGPIFNESAEYIFNFTDYYQKEFGKDLKKRIVIFSKAVSKDDLAKVRHETAAIEKSFAVKDKRTANIDPGFISPDGVYLATLKQKAWKEALNLGVYLHKVLEFNNENIIEFKHTFKDYRSIPVQKFLKQAHDNLFTKENVADS